MKCAPTIGAGKAQTRTAIGTDRIPGGETIGRKGCAFSALSARNLRNCDWRGFRATVYSFDVSSRVQRAQSMEIQQIRYFLAVSDTLNFTRAAELCNISQPALTRAIQALESELGGTLVNRERRYTHLTELGRLMEPYFRAIHSQTITAKNAAASLLSIGAGSLRLGAMCTIGPSVVANFVADFARKHPGIEIQVEPLPLGLLRQRLIAGHIEIALIAFPDAAPNDLHCLPLFEEAFAVAVAPGHRFASADFVRAADLDGEPYINRSNCEYYDAVSAAFAARGISMHQIFSSECDEWVIGMVKAGLGLGFVPEFAVNDGNIILKPLADPAFKRTVSMATVRGRRHSPSVGALIRQARQEQWPTRRKREVHQLSTRKRASPS
jgi:DNA-binding transcriptional LysR family regulator